MHKKKPIPTPQILPNKKKEMLKIIQNPEAMKRVLELVNSSANLFDKSKTVKACSMIDWVERCIAILPENLEHLDNFILKFKEFVDNYGEELNGTGTKQSTDNN